MRSRGGFLLVLILLPVLAIGGAVALFPSWFSGSKRYFESEAPVLSWGTLPKALGAPPMVVKAIVADSARGVSEAIFRVEQQGKTIELARQQCPKGCERIELAPEIEAQKLGLREGEATLHLTAFDRSFWSNTASLSHQIRVVFSRPRIEVLSSQHNVAQGGSNLLVYRILSGEIEQSGVLVRDVLFRGFPAAAFHPAFERDPRAYAALFAIPKDFDARREALTAVAIDVTGNRASASFYSKVLPRSFRPAPIRLSENFLRTKVPELLPGAVDALKISLPEGDAVEDLLAQFRVINEEYRRYLDGVIQESLRVSQSKRFFSGVLLRGLAGASTSAFGERRTYEFDGKTITRSEHDGIDLAAVSRATVRSAAGGRIVFAGDLGIYGGTVIIDHGLGLSTLYGHLSSMSVSVGDEIGPDVVIGTSGATGLAGGDHLHFEVRVGGVPVTPIEWWDGKWVNDHIDGKLREVAAAIVVVE